MTRSEHIEWCKGRAMRYLEVGDTMNAFSSMLSDLRKHPETENHMAIQMGMMLMVGGQMKTMDEVRSFIEGFS